jgi:wobble nucleotide-excising tRNase
MIKNNFSETDGSRTAYLDRLDKALEEFESEYHYLFNIAYKYKDDGTIENAYKMPNIARKLLDTFLMFRVPKNVSPYKRLEEIKYDEQKKSAIYKFSNDQSHITGSGFDPSLVPEAKNCIKDLLDMMKAVDPEHYKYLEETVS